MGQEAFVTFGANDSSALGCVVLAHSLRKHGTLRSLVALVTDDINPKIRTLLSGVFDVIQCVPKLNLNDQLSSAGQSFPEANVALTKLNCWRLTQFTKCVYLDADTLVLQNCDELFSRDELSAVPDIGWPDCLNSGVFVFVPSLHTYWALVNILRRQGSFDGSDQGLLNCYFGEEWRRDLSKRLPFIYNLVSSTSYTYAPAYQQFGKNAKVVHFVGYPKPWSTPWNSHSGKIQPSTETAHQERFLQEWLDIFVQNVLPLLPEVEQHVGTDAYTFECDNQAPTSTTAIHAPPSSNQEFFTHLPPQNVQYSFIHNADQHDQIAGHQFHEHGTKEPASFTPSEVKSVHEDSRKEPASFTSSEVNSVHEDSWKEPESFASSEVQSVHEDSRKEPASFTPSEVHSVNDDSRKEPAIVTSHQVQSLEQDKQGTDGQYKPTAPTFDLSRVTYHSRPAQYSGQETTAEQAVGLVPSVENVEETNAEPLTKEEMDQLRMQEWQEGQIDYQGRDSFENIWRHLLRHIEDSPVSEDEIAADQACDSKANDPSCSEVHDGAPSYSEAHDGADTGTSSMFSEPEIGLPGYPVGDYTAMHRWEQGNIDYVGRDSSDRIMRRLDYLIHGTGFQSDQS